MVAHNHPSDCDKFSPADIELTKSLIKVAELLEIRVLDHFLIAGSDCVSFAEQGAM